MSDERLIETARRALGATEEVIAAGIFHPRGTTGGRVGATAAGFSTDNIVGQVAGVAVGAMAGHVAAEARGVPLRTILAVTPTHLYGFVAEADGVHWKAGERFATFDRSRMEVTVHARANVHTLTIVDPDTGRTYEWEGNRIGPDHANAVIHALEVEVTEEGDA